MSTTCLGGLCICTGLLNIGSLLGNIHEYITKDHRVISPANDTKAKQICRIFARVLSFISFFAAAVAAFTLGAALYTTGPAIGLIAAFQAGLLSSVPALITSLAAATFSAVGQKIGN